MFIFRSRFDNSFCNILVITIQPNLHNLLFNACVGELGQPPFQRVLHVTSSMLFFFKSHSHHTPHTSMQVRIELNIFHIEELLQINIHHWNVHEATLYSMLLIVYILNLSINIIKIINSKSIKYFFSACKN